MGNGKRCFASVSQDVECRRLLSMDLRLMIAFRYIFSHRNSTKESCLGLEAPTAANCVVWLKGEVVWIKAGCQIDDTQYEWRETERTVGQTISLGCMGCKEDDTGGFSCKRWM